MTAVLVVSATFCGLALCIGTVATAILLANGKLTIRGTNMRRIAQAETSLRVAQAKLETERVQTMLDAQIDLRTRAALPAAPEGDEVAELLRHT